MILLLTSVALAGPPVAAIPSTVPSLNQTTVPATDDDVRLAGTRNVGMLNAIKDSREIGILATTPGSIDFTDFLENIVISGDLAIAPGGGLVSPSVAGVVTDTSVFKGKGGEPKPGLANEWSVAFDFQAPPTPDDAAAVADQIKLSGGGTGSLELSDMIAKSGDKSGITAGIHGKLAWQTAGTVSATATPDGTEVQALDSSSFFLATGSASVGVYYLVYFGAKYSYFYAAGSPDSALVSTIGTSPHAVQAMIAAKLKLDGSNTDAEDRVLWLTIEGLPWTGATTSGSFADRVQVSLSTSFKPF